MRQLVVTRIGMHMPSERCTHTFSSPHDIRHPESHTVLMFEPWEAEEKNGIVVRSFSTFIFLLSSWNSNKMLFLYAAFIVTIKKKSAFCLAHIHLCRHVHRCYRLFADSFYSSWTRSPIKRRVPKWNGCDSRFAQQISKWNNNNV